MAADGLALSSHNAHQHLIRHPRVSTCQRFKPYPIPLLLFTQFTVCKTICPQLPIMRETWARPVKFAPGQVKL